MNKLKHFMSPAAIILLAALCFPGAGYGANFGVTGGNWNIGVLLPNWTISTTGNKWNITLTDAKSPYLKGVYISVAGQGSWNPSSATGNNGVNTFVLREDNSSGKVILATGTLLSYAYSPETFIYDFDLWFNAPAAGSALGSYSLAATLTAEPVIVGAGEWLVVDNDIVVVGTGTTGKYLMWPRPLNSPGTRNNTTLAWKDALNCCEPRWDNVTKSYVYANGTQGNYPAFSWAQSLNWKGYDDWRLPTKAELELLLQGYSNIEATTNLWWSSTPDLTANSNAWRVRFSDGLINSSTKTGANSVRVVRTSW